MKKNALIVLLGTALALPLAAQAEGAYVGVNVGRGESKFSFDGESIKDKGSAFKLYGGYGLTKNFGVEAGFVRLTKITGADEDGPFSFKPRALYVAATGTLPLTNEFSLFAKAGVTRNRVKAGYINVDGTPGSDKYNNTDVMFGFGAAYNLTQNLGVVAEYENFGKTADEGGLTLKANMLSLGLRYKF